MIIASLPDGFRLAMAGDVARVDLPPMIREDDRTYEPVLSRKDADRVAAVITIRERKRRAAGAGAVLTHVRLAHVAGYSRAALASFRARISIALVELGHELSIDERTTMTGMGTLVGG